VSGGCRFPGIDVSDDWEHVIRWRLDLTNQEILTDDVNMSLFFTHFVVF
jgi:hypothetical protein